MKHLLTQEKWMRYKPALAYPDPLHMSVSKQTPNPDTDSGNRANWFSDFPTNKQMWFSQSYSGSKNWQKLYIPAWPLDVPFTPLLPYWPLFSSEGLPIPSSFPFQATPAFLMSCQEPNSFFSQLAKVRWTKFISAVGKCKRLHWKSHQSWNWSLECN